MHILATEEQIRALAYRLWAEAGSPQDRSDEFWLLAQQRLASEPGMGIPKASEREDMPPESV
ncbi:DUF2934 domain-containing protein [Caballeronia glebae]|jgi:hypothetical protein|uniref:DUF2934 domain-containing protein n=1 Tax=Caballeronia glebae TaxID=1777143 RepID=A0A158APH0_9BURK|nr:DUF2934 domain-containing protein [Caballeronia glebae]SAK59818.1 hypothetical protein AWB82_02730 [Caballeronia glebae]